MYFTAVEVCHGRTRIHFFVEEAPLDLAVAGISRINVYLRGRRLSVGKNEDSSISRTDAFVAVIHMNSGVIGRLVAACLATFLIVTVAVTELLQSHIEFSLLVGIPAGLVAGAVAAGVVALGFADGAPKRRQRIASAFGAFAIGVLVAIVVGALFPAGTALTLTVGTIVGLLIAVVVYRRDDGRARQT